VGPRVLVALPVLAALTPLLAFTHVAWVAVAGSLVWGCAVGIQESTLRATVADLAPAARRATAFGVYAAVLGAGTFVGGAVTGALYDVSIRALVITVVAIQVAAVVLLALSRRR
ncbi:MAG: MFS transporter, partial [Nocardioides sp.]|nr:MFS transporter [Nocardioides sp.]